VADFDAPFVKESQLKIGMQFSQAIDIPLNGTILVIGEIDHLIIPEEIMGAYLRIEYLLCTRENSRIPLCKDK